MKISCSLKFNKAEWRWDLDLPYEVSQPVLLVMFKLQPSPYQKPAEKRYGKHLSTAAHHRERVMGHEWVCDTKIFTLFVTFLKRTDLKIVENLNAFCFNENVKECSLIKVTAFSPKNIPFWAEICMFWAWQNKSIVFFWWNFQVSLFITFITKLAQKQNKNFLS